MKKHNKPEPEPEMVVAPTDAVILKEFMDTYHVTAEHICDQLDYGSITLIKNILSGSQQMPQEFRNRFNNLRKKREKHGNQ